MTARLTGSSKTCESKYGRELRQVCFCQGGYRCKYHASEGLYAYIFLFLSQAKSVTHCSISDKTFCQGYSPALGHRGDNGWVAWSCLCFSVQAKQKGKAIIDGSRQSQRQKLIRWTLQKLSWYQMKLIIFCSSIMPGTGMHPSGWETSVHQNAKF